MNKKRVAIIGGGLAAMATAEHLARNGPQGERSSADHSEFTIDLFEAKRRTGGRAGSFEVGGPNDAGDLQSEEVDYCQHVAMGCCTELIGLMRRAGILQCWTPYRELSFRHPEHAPSRFRPSRWLPPPLHLAPTVFSMRYLSWQQKQQLVRAMFRLIRATPQSLADVTAGQWLSHMGQDRATVERFWEVILVSALGESIDAVSMAAARKVIVDGFVAGASASDVWVPNETLANLFGTRLPNYLSTLGPSIHTQTAVRQIKRFDSDNGNRSAGFEVVLRDGDCCAYDACVFAVPWHRAGALMSSDIAEELGADRWASIPASPITGIHLWFDRQITNVPHAVLVGTTAQWLFRSPTVDCDPHYYQVVVSASHDLSGKSKDEIVATVLAELRHEFPDARDAQLLQARIVADPNSVFSVTPAVESMRPTTRTAIDGLFLAGDWVQTGWPSTMEGAVISGRLAAEACRAFLSP